MEAQNVFEMEKEVSKAVGSLTQAGGGGGEGETIPLNSHKA